MLRIVLPTASNARILYATGSHLPHRTLKHTSATISLSFIVRAALHYSACCSEKDEIWSRLVFRANAVTFTPVRISNSELRGIENREAECRRVLCPVIFFLESEIGHLHYSLLELPGYNNSSKS